MLKIFEFLKKYTVVVRRYTDNAVKYCKNNFKRLPELKNFFKNISRMTAGFDKKKYAPLAAAVAFSLIAGYSLSFMNKSDDSKKSIEAVNYIQYQPAETTAPAETAEEIVTGSETERPDLLEDSFSKTELEILHTDFEPSEKLEDEIMQLVNNYNKTCSFYMVDLTDYAVFGYNSDTYIPTASTIKCPFAFYCYNEIEKGNHSFDDTVLYKRGYYSSGTGVLKDYGNGTYYKVGDLLYYMIHYSDNVAFLMLQDYFGYEGYNEMISDMGFETFINGQIKWGKLSSHELGYIWTQIFDYRNECEEGAIFYEDLVYAGSNFFNWPFTEAGYEYNIAHKSGWASPGYHDSGIVLSDNPFVIVVMTESEGETRDSSFFYNMSLTLNELHDEYLEYMGREPSEKGVKSPSELVPENSRAK